MLFDLFLISAAFALGGIIKGATGAGSAVVAVPILVLLYDVPTAVTIFVLPNVISNTWQSWKYRGFRLRPIFVGQFVLAGALGVAVGTFILKQLSSSALSLIVAGVVAIYITFRLLRPDWSLSRQMAERIATPVGLLAGILQGASGISAPISVTFLNAMKLDKREFVATISIFFLVIGIVQLPMMAYFGLLNLERASLGLVALVAMLAFMPVGAALMKKVSAQAFDWIILVLLGVLSARLVFSAIFG